MTDNEIIKALECCSWKDEKHCEICPYDKKETNTYCSVDLAKDALHLINRQKANNKEIWEERNRIHESLKETETELEEYRKAYVDGQAEIERLQQKIENLNKAYPCTVKMNDYCLIYARSLDDYDNLIGEISSEGIKEFAERFKKKSTTVASAKTNPFATMGYELGLEYRISKWELDNLVKEMVGDDK